VVAGLVTAGIAALEAKLASFVKDNRLPGAAAGVIHGNELVWSDARASRVHDHRVL